MAKFFVIQAWDKDEAIRKARRKFPKFVAVRAVLVKPNIKTYKVLLKPRKIKKKRK